MVTAIQVAITGLLAGLAYAVAASGLAVVFAAGRVLNLAHGAFFALGAYIAYQTSAFGVPGVLGTLPALLAGAALGAAIERGLVRSRCTEPVAAALVLLGAAILAEQVFGLLWGVGGHSVPFRLPVYIAGGIVFTAEQAIEAAGAVAALTGLWAVRRSGWGVAWDAAVDDPEMALVSGIDVGRLRTAAFSLGCGLASAAGALLSPALAITPDMGWLPLVVSTAAVAASRRGHIGQAAPAGVAVGLATTVVGLYAPPPLPYMFALLLLGAALAPRGGALRAAGW